MKNNKNVYTFNLCLFGSEYIGKSYLINRYINNSYSSYFSYPNNSEFKTKTINIRGNTINLKICEKKYQYYKSLNSYNLNKINGLFLIYDVTYSPSFNNIKKILKDIDQYLNEDAKECKILIGCKSDEDSYRKVKEDEGKSLADEFSIPFFEVSAKNKYNVDEIFLFLANKILRYKENEI